MGKRRIAKEKVIIRKDSRKRVGKSDGVGTWKKFGKRKKKRKLGKIGKTERKMENKFEHQNISKDLRD